MSKTVDNIVDSSREHDEYLTQYNPQQNLNKSLSIPTDTNQLRDVVYNQLMNNIKLINHIKELNKLERQKEVTNARNNLITELKNELHKQSLSCKKPKLKRTTPYEMYKMRKTYYANIKPYHVQIKKENNYEK